MSDASGPEQAAARRAGTDGPVAIIGIGCRYADARGPAEFWEIVRSGRDTVREAPPHRVELGYDLDHFYDPRPRIPGRISSKKAGFLEHPELFDPAPFGISPRDAVTMDPQQRLMVEVTWDALEDAGIVPGRIAGERVAVIFGYMAEDYSRERTGVLGEEAVFRGHDVFTVGGMSHAVLSGRVAFLLGVTGPSFTLDTACSSSLYATHLACQSLRRGEANLALAGGVNLFLSPEGNIALSRSGMLSMSGACRAFDANADGFVRAEGAGVVVLKRLADALEDGDPIYAVIRGSGVSSDGRDGGHMMAPGRHGQAQAMRDAYAEAGVDPSRIQYVETHGTGTMIGDPVEIAALADVMGPGRDPDKPLRVASVKGNLGHSEPASGVAGLIKACLAMRHRLLPAQMHFETPNPAIPWDDVPVRVQDETTPWPEPGPALVGVNSFGISGTNAHVILEDPPEPAARPVDARPAARPLLLPIAGHEPNALRDMTIATREHLRDLSGPALDDYVHTLTRHRTHHAHRLAVVGSSADALGRALDAHLAGETPPSVRTGVAEPDRPREVVMVFPGQGAQWAGMGRDLLAEEPVFADAIDRIDAAYRAHVDWSLRAALEGRGLDFTARLDVLQPTLVALEIALAELWASLGVRPARVIGQSMGEIAAAHVAGALDLEATARLACHRGRVVARASGRGAMAVVALGRVDVEARLAEHGGRLEVAGTSSPRTTIVSGDRDALGPWLAEREAEDVFARRLEVDFASHCFHMDPLLEGFRAGLDGLEVSAPRIPMHSTVDAPEAAGIAGGEAPGVDYWLRNLRAPVVFDRALREALEAGGEVVLEVSPHPSLPRAVEEIARAAGRSAVYVPTLLRDTPESESVATHLGALWAAGAHLDLGAAAPEGRVVPTPLYAYQRERYWFAERTRLDQHRATHPLLGRPTELASDPALRLWDFAWDADTASFAAERGRGGECVAPTGLFVELALAAAEAAWPGASVAVRDLVLRDALAIGPGGRRTVQVALRREDDRGELRVASRGAPGEAWVLHATARFEPGAPGILDASKFGAAPFADEASLEPVGLDALEALLAADDRRVGSRARVWKTLAREDDAALVAKLMLPRSIEAEWQAYHAHPALVEGAFDASGLLGGAPCASDVRSIDRIELAAGLGSEAHARLRATRDGDAIDLRLFARSGDPVGRLEGIRLRRRPLARRAEGRVDDDLPLRLGWRAWQAPSAEVADGPERWLVISDSATEAGLVATELRKRGGASRFCEKVEDLAGLAHVMDASDDSAWGLLVLAWGRPSREPGSEPDSHRAFRIGSWAEAIREHTLGAGAIWIATRGLVSTRAGEDRLSLAAQRVVGEIEAFTSCLELERCRFFDAGPAPDADERTLLAERMLAGGPERRWVARGPELLVERLAPEPLAGTAAPRERAGERNWRATWGDADGFPSRLVFRAAPELAPGPGEVAVAVEAVGLDALDVRAELGLASDETGRGVGHGFAGRVLAVGAGVDDLRPGDAVFGVDRGALGRREVFRRARLARAPEGASPTTIAARVTSDLIAREVFDGLASLRAEERVLVDVGAGPVAQALVQRARAIGARADVPTRGADANRRLAAAGARVVAIEDGGTWDVVVSHASGPALRARLSRLAPGGRGIDLRPAAARALDESAAADRAPNRSLACFDLDALLEDETIALDERLAEIARERSGVAAGATLAPITVFPVDQAPRALRFMAQGRHPGAVALDGSVERAGEVRLAPPVDAFERIAGRRVLVSGTPGPVLEAIARVLDRKGAGVVEVAPDSPPAVLRARAQGPDGPPALWVHVADDAAPSRTALRDALRDTPEASRIFVALRSASGDGAPGERLWETRAWIDRLALGSRTDHGGGLAHAIVAADASATRIERALEAALRESSAREDPLVFVGSEERAARGESPLFEAVSSTSTAKAGGGALGRAALLGLEPAERRAALETLVIGELAGVLGLDEERRESLAPTRRLDEVGLDSLMTLELFVGLSRALELEIAPDWFEGIPSLREVATTLADRLGGADGEGAA